MDDGEYAALAKFISDIGIGDVLPNDVPKNFLRIIVPQVADSALDNDDDKTKVKSFLFCMNIAAYDLQLVVELNELFGYREAFDYHRKATLKMIVDACNEFRTGNWLHREQPLKKIMKTAEEKQDRFIGAIQRSEGANANDSHRRWCEIFLGFRY